VVVKILVAQSEPVYALAQHAQQRVLDLGSLPRVADGAGNTPKEFGPAVRETKQGSPAIAGHISPGKVGLDNPSTEAWNRKLERGAIWHGGASF